MKKIALIIMMMIGVNLSYANDVYIEQVGDGSTVSITQQGTGNKVGDSTTFAYIGSGSNNITVDQIGSSNILDMVVNGLATNVTINTNGSGNSQEVQCGTASAGGSSCSGSTITQTVTGDNNVIKQLLGAGANHTSNITVTGDTNNVTHTSTATGTTRADVTVTGSTNNVSVTQSGMTTQGVTLNTTGAGNTITVNQSN